MMLEGRFKVFSNCQEWFEEYRVFHRKEGKIVAINDDTLKASLYALMEKRHSMTEMITQKRKPRARAGLRQVA